MNNNLGEQAARARAVTNQLSQAVGKYALTQAQVDGRITSHLIEIGVELESLGARVEKLERALAPRKKATRSGAHT